MTRVRQIWLVVIGAAAALGLLIWVANNTYWTDITVPLPLKGEAAVNPFYALERFAKALGAHTEWNRGVRLPPADGVVFISGWDWDLTSDRRQRLEHWVESGGRLVVDNSLIHGTDAFEQWSGIKQELTERPKRSGAQVQTRVAAAPTTRCYTLNETGDSHDSYSICGMDVASSLKTTRRVSWALGRDDRGLQAVRIKLGRGSVTMLNGTPFVARGLFDDDNGRLFVAATQLRRGDQIHFFSESSHASLLGLAWQLGWPVVCLLLVLTALALWRGGARFGPLVAPADIARRSLAEQIRGTGQFTLRVGGGESLHAAAARALNEVAALHISAYERLPGTERMSALARATGFEADSLAAALHYSGARRSDHLGAAIELLESARRRILIKNTRSRHGNRI
ncbi:MAG: hypothetical protein ACJ8R9_29845 [Steroidobacteraceae bacterium]